MNAPAPRRIGPWIRMFQIAAIAEAFTWAGLLVGMVFKYLVVHNDWGVRVFGTVHGFVMILYIMACGIVRPDMRWTGRQTLIAIGASVPPLLTFPFERWAIKRYLALPPDEPVVSGETTA
jgi:integral membrane protein